MCWSKKSFCPWAFKRGASWQLQNIMEENRKEGGVYTVALDCVFGSSSALFVCFIDCSMTLRLSHIVAGGTRVLVFF